MTNIFKFNLKRDPRQTEDIILTFSHMCSSQCTVCGDLVTKNKHYKYDLTTFNHQTRAIIATGMLKIIKKSQNKQ